MVLVSPTAGADPEPAEAAQWIEPEETARFTLQVNGEPIELEVPTRYTLADALRGAGLTGTHLGCEHGVCGACTVLLDGAPVRACLMFAIQANGHAVETVEGLATDDELNPLQRNFNREGALQCGFCTPGFLMLASGVLREDPEAPEERVRERLSSNICRCTGGPPIAKAVLAAQREMRGERG